MYTPVALLRCASGAADYWQLPNFRTQGHIIGNKHVNVSSQGDHGYLPEADEEGTCVLTQHVVRAGVAKLPAHIANVP